MTKDHLETTAGVDPESYSSGTETVGRIEFRNRDPVGIATFKAIVDELELDMLRINQRRLGDLVKAYERLIGDLHKQIRELQKENDFLRNELMGR